VAANTSLGTASLPFDFPSATHWANDCWYARQMIASFLFLFSLSSLQIIASFLSFSFSFFPFFTPDDRFISFSIPPFSHLLTGQD
jgi:hypothetical protein